MKIFAGLTARNNPIQKRSIVFETRKRNENAIAFQTIEWAVKHPNHALDVPQLNRFSRLGLQSVLSVANAK